MQPDSAQATNRRTKFSIKSLLALTVAAALWLVLFRANQELSLIVLGPITYVLVAWFWGNATVLFWTPAVITICFVLADELFKWNLLSRNLGAVSYVATIVALVASTVSRVRKKFSVKNSRDRLIFFTIGCSALNGALLALSIAISFVFAALFLEFVSVPQSEEWRFAAFFGGIFSPFIGGLVGVLMGLPLALISEIVIQHDFQKQAPMSNNETIG